MPNSRRYYAPMSEPDAHNVAGPLAGPTSLGMQLLQPLSCALVKFSRPLMQTGRIQTGPHAQWRYGYFAGRERPGYERFGVLALTFWAGHPPLSQPLRSRVRKTPSRRLSVLLKVCRLLHTAITFVHDGAS